MRMDSKFNMETKMRLWKSMIEDFELTWLKDVPSSAASKIVEMTLQKMRETRAREDAWRIFFSDRLSSDSVYR